MPDATPEEIKKAYYSCMKACHPDLSGDNPEVTNFCMFINEVYTVKPFNETLGPCDCIWQLSWKMCFALNSFLFKTLT